MKLDIVALVLGLLGTAGSIITFLAFYPTEKRKRKAEARKLEIEGDATSVKFLTDLIDEIKLNYKEVKEENKVIKGQFEALKREFEELKKKLNVKEWLVSIYEKAGKFCHDCPFIPTGSKCPAVEEYEKLTQ